MALRNAHRQSSTGIIHWVPSYPVSLAAFDGPLDLLLQLIERHELDISEVSLCAVTDQYLSTLEQLTDVEPAALADFLSVASRLLYIKSSSCCPDPAMRKKRKRMRVTRWFGN